MTTMINSNLEQEISKKDNKVYKKTNETPQVQFEKMVKKFMENDPFVKYINMNHELEVRFGTRGIKPLTKIDYNNVIQKIKSLGFSCANEEGEYMLRIQNEYLDSKTGRFDVSKKIRTEIRGFQVIQDYCKHNDLKKLLSSEFYSGNNVEFHNKTLYRKDNENLFPVNFDDFNFRVSYQTEEKMALTNPIIRSIIEGWDKSKKVFRYINRVSFEHPDIPVMVDLSIVKNSNSVNRRMKPVYTTAEAGVFENQEIFEIELEVINSKVGPGTQFPTPELLLAGIRKSIKYILMGLQGTNYPISYPEQNDILHEYMKTIHENNYNEEKRIYPSDFIGPSSYTLQLQNVIPLNQSSSAPNIRKDYCVTEKADGERHLMYISKKGKIYLINTGMKVLFTGAETDNIDCFNSLLDGEIVHHDKYGKYINLYAAFDIYYIKGKDVRAYGFMPRTAEDIESKFRLPLLKNLIKELKPHYIVTGQSQNSKEKITQKELGLSPIRIESKKFYSSVNNKNANSSVTIFDLCKIIIDKEKQGLFEYNTDGLIFTPENMGVGADRIGKAGPLSKSTWEYSFKWKPPQFNTIDFLVTTKKDENGADEMTTIFQDGTNTTAINQINQYKTIVLRCGFDERKHGFLNPVQDVIDDKLPSMNDLDNEELYKPVQFYPTSPYDPLAGLCNIMLEKDETGIYQMFTEERQVFTDNTIVEFRYELNKKALWNWVPLRVRYDKTSELKQGIKNFGNAYHVANSNWYSIHNPITEEMICTGRNIQDDVVDDDVYYNRNGVDTNITRGLRDFHNLYVKKMLITGVSKNGNTLIDYACGKGGDFPKWIKSNLSFVFGIDVSKDNLENKLDGACARFLKYKKTTKNMPYALFVNGNSSANIRSGAAMLNDKAIQITRAVFGDGPKSEEKLGKGVYRQYGKGEDGFNVSSCQFALHYFFENRSTFQNFIRNVSECTKLGGYFIGTCYDGKTIFNMLKNKQEGESIQIYDRNIKVWEVEKEYSETEFNDDSTCLGYKINVYQESINKMFSEYLVNFDYMERIMENYGFKLLTRDEAKEKGLPNGTGMFNELFNSMQEEIKRNRYVKSEYKEAPNMNAYEKKISFLNRYFIYKKIAHVNAEKISIEFIENEGEDEDEDAKSSKSSSSKSSKSLEKSSSKSKSSKENKKAVTNISSKRQPETSKKSKKATTSKNTKMKPPVKKLNKLIILEDTNDVIQTSVVPENMQVKTAVPTTATGVRPTTSKLMIEGDDDDVDIEAEAEDIGTAALPAPTSIVTPALPSAATSNVTPALQSLTSIVTPALPGQPTSNPITETKKTNLKKKKTKLIIQED